MDIEIIGTESLEVRGLCCFVRTDSKRILFDPGIALGFHRYGLLPHPFQVAVDERIQKKIVKRWSDATDIVISHFHGDHIPLVNANPYQFNVKKIIGLNPKVKIWSKSLSHLSMMEKARADALSLILNKDLIVGEGRKQGRVTFSEPMIHGEEGRREVTVIMTKIEEDGQVFVHAPGIELLNDRAISQILDWKPDIALVDGTPLYLHNRLSGALIKKAWSNAKRLSQNINILILDHHIMRNYEGIKWIKRLSIETKNNVICSADFMKVPRMLLEAKRRSLYKDTYVPDGWHEAYAKGKVTTNRYWSMAKNCKLTCKFFIKK
ncbi:MAG: MBL fold metallo-hydrolase [Candidatus Caldatribacteriota bacterium]|nr:MBL fold metallo-hydrolase [Candidatus Caldatribacteriota bacterium]